MITKNSVVKIQNLAVNHKSRPAKSNPAVLENISYEGLRKMVKVEISPNNQQHKTLILRQSIYSYYPH